MSRARLFTPEPTLLLKDRHGAILGEVENERHAAMESLEGVGFWPVPHEAERVIAAVIAIEDRRFWSHPGVDPVAIGRAIVQNVQGQRRVSGASTLAMQIARMQDPGSRGYFNKAIEAVTALLITARYGRADVLQHYLRIAPFSNRVRGIGYAARRYFDKPVEDLSWAEIAFLSAIPQSPRRMNPYTPRGRIAAERRGRQILALLRSSGVLTSEEHSLAITQIGGLHIEMKPVRPLGAMHAILRIESQLKDKPIDGRRPIVDTTLDLALTDRVSRLAHDAVDQWTARGAGNAAVVVVDRASNEVVAYVGSTDYFDEARSGSIDYARVPRSSGSTLKPFIYGAAIDRGFITPATILDDIAHGPGGIANSDGRFLGPLLPRVALANSRNVPVVGLVERFGRDRTFDFLRQVGLHDGVRSAEHYGLGMALGALEVRLDHLVRAYGALASDGRLRPLRWHDRHEAAPAPRVMSEDTARHISLFLSDPMARLPTFSRMGSTEYPYAVAIKTGTSHGYRDAWAVAYSDRTLVGVWVGHPDYRPMNALGGSSSAAVLVSRVMSAIHVDRGQGLTNHGFATPRGHKPIETCARTGHRANDACDSVHTEYFAPGREPVETCGAHRRGAIDRRNGLLATSLTPSDQMEVKTFTDLGPRYAAWADRQGLAGMPVSFSDLARGAVARVQISQPSRTQHILRDPEVPAELATLGLEAIVDPPVEQVVWYVDGQPFALADYPYAVRWPLKPGEHSFSVRVPRTGQHSDAVTVVVH